MIRFWQCLRFFEQLPTVNGSVKLRCNPTSILFAVASAAARSESDMKTMALTEVILPALQHRRAASVSSTERPQSSALMISIRLEVCAHDSIAVGSKEMFVSRHPSGLRFLCLRVFDFTMA